MAPDPAAVVDRARRAAENLSAELERQRRWAANITTRGREAFDDPADETLYLAAQAVIINLAEALERRTPPQVLAVAAIDDVPALRGMRNRLAHDYLVVDKAIVWEAISRDVPALLDRLLADGVLVPERFMR